MTSEADTKDVVAKLGAALHGIEDDTLIAMSQKDAVFIRDEIVALRAEIERLKRENDDLWSKRLP
jgi:polyhydroxyalkanoate synthesis regulator phasin